MAVPSTSEDLRNVELQTFWSSKGGPGYFAEGRHLSIQDAKILLTNKEDTRHDSGKKMLETLTNLEPHGFEHIQQEFPVHRLQHVTVKDSMDGIYMEERFKIMKPDFRSGYKDFSFWSADIVPKDIAAARIKACEDAKKVLPKLIFRTYENKIRDQFANSPAFDKSASRYGNFKFSFQLSDLLKLYRDQHCGDEEPQLRILGTDLFKQEITHYILVHSPDQSHRFTKLLDIPSEDGSGLHFVHLRDETVYWRPESTSISLKVKISEDSPVPEKLCSGPCIHYKPGGLKCVVIKNIKSVWNYLVFAFHLPDRHDLKIQKTQLFKSLKACKILEPALIDESKYLELTTARNFIKEKKPKRQKRKRSFEAQNGIVKNKSTEDPPPQSEPPLPSGDTTTRPEEEEETPIAIAHSSALELSEDSD